MSEDYFVIRVPRLAGRKTLLFNLAVLAFAAYGAMCALLQAEWWRPIDLDAAAILAFVALCNVALRALTDRPVYFRSSIEAEWRDAHAAADKADAHIARYMAGVVDEYRKPYSQTPADYAGALRPIPHVDYKAVKGESGHEIGSLGDYIVRQSNVYAVEHDKRNAENVERIEKHLQHLRASELPPDFDEDVPVNGGKFRN